MTTLAAITGPRLLDRLQGGVRDRLVHALCLLVQAAVDLATPSHSIHSYRIDICTYCIVKAPQMKYLTAGPCLVARSYHPLTVRCEGWILVNLGLRTIAKTLILCSTKHWTAAEPCGLGVATWPTPRYH